MTYLDLYLKALPMETLRTKSGRVLTDEIVEDRARRAEEGYDPTRLRSRRADHVFDADCQPAS